MVAWNLKTKGVLLLLLLQIGAVAQKAPSGSRLGLEAFPYQSLHWEETPEHLWQEIEEHLKPAQNLNFRLWKERKSLTGKHLYYEVLKEGVAIENALLSLHHNRDGSITVDLPQLPTNRPDQGTWRLPSPLMWCREFKDSGQWQIDLGPDQRWLYLQGQLTKGYVLKAHQPDGGHYLFYGNGPQVWQVIDQRLYQSDTPVKGMVFYPDPLTSANLFYGGLYRDQNDQDDPVLNNERQSVEATATYRNGLFHLENKYLKILDFSAPSVAPVTSSTGQFNYLRSQDGFEDYNTLYHISRFKHYVDSLGFGQVANYAVEVDPHALNNADQSFYIHSEKRIYLGEGGVDDAEDADVIVHEYGHAFINDAIPVLGSATNERAALEEALCDFFAYSYSAALNTNQDNWVFNWDGHNEFWAGRLAVSQKDYTTLSFSGSIYAHTDILVSCLREINQNCGRAVSTSLSVEALFRCNPNTSYRDFAHKMLEVEGLLYNKQYYQQVRSAFVRRAILPADVSLQEWSGTASSVSLSATLAFSQGGAAYLASDQGLRSYTLFNGRGSVVARQLLKGEKSTHVAASTLAPGFYLLQVIDHLGQTHSFKLLRTP